jgi:hypothetical protein
MARLAGYTEFDYIDANKGFAIGGVAVTATAAELNALHSAGLALAEIGVLDGVTPGTVAASKAVVVSADKDIGDFRNLDAVNIDAGASGVAGSVDVFPAAENKGKLTIAVTNQTGDTTVTLQVDAMGQASAIHIPDPGAAAAYVAMSTAALSLAEMDVLQDVTPGTAAVSKALILDSGGKLTWGTGASPISVATADHKIFALYGRSTATSGDSRALYVKHELNGVAPGGFGDAVRAYAVVGGSGYAYACGLHSSLAFAASGALTGSGAALRATLEAAADTRTLPGNIAALQLESFIATGNTVPADAAFIRLCKAGDVDLETFLHVEDDQCLKGSAATGAATNALPVRMPDGSTLYISLIAAA